MEIELLEIAGMQPVHRALHLPFGKGISNNTEKDNALISRLVKAGDEHAKVMRGLIIWIEVNAPIYWWREMKHIATVEKGYHAKVLCMLIAKDFKMKNFKKQNRKFQWERCKEQLICLAIKLFVVYISSVEITDYQNGIFSVNL